METQADSASVREWQLRYVWTRAAASSGGKWLKPGPLSKSQRVGCRVLSRHTGTDCSSELLGERESWM